MRYEDYQRVYRNAKAKERRLKKNHSVTVDMAILTPTEFRKSKNKKREIEKLKRFTDRNNPKYQYVNLGKKSVKRSQYSKISQENQRLVNAINYHKDKNIKAVLDKPYLIYNTVKGEVIETDMVINDRISELKRQSLSGEKNRSMVQKTPQQLNKYNKYLKTRLKALKKGSQSLNQKKNYIDKVKDFKHVLKGTPYEKEYAKFMKKLKSMSPDDFTRFYYLSDFGAVDRVVYISDSDIGTPEGQKKVLDNMKGIISSIEAVERLTSM